MCVAINPVINSILNCIARYGENLIHENATGRPEKFKLTQQMCIVDVCYCSRFTDSLICDQIKGKCAWVWWNAFVTCKYILCALR